MEQISFFDTTRDLILPPIKVLLEDEKPMSWNKMYAGGHWGSRKSEADRVHDLMACQLIGAEMFEVPVHVVIEVGFKDKRKRDPDNIAVKFYIDGLVGRVIEEDTIDHIKSLLIIGVRSDRNYVQIIVSPWRV